MQRLAFYSRDVLAGMRSGHGIAYERTEGLLQLMRADRDVSMAQNTLAFLKTAGVAHQLMTAAECRVREPGLSDIALRRAASTCPTARPATVRCSPSI